MFPRRFFTTCSLCRYLPLFVAICAIYVNEKLNAIVSCCCVRASAQFAWSRSDLLRLGDVISRSESATARVAWLIGRKTISYRTFSAAAIFSAR